MLSNLNVLNASQMPMKKKRLPTRAELAKFKRILDEIPIRRKMKEEQLIWRYNFQKHEHLQNLKNEKDRIISLENTLMPSLRYKIPTSTGGAFAHAKNRLEQIDMQYDDEANKAIPKMYKKY